MLTTCMGEEEERRTRRYASAGPLFSLLEPTVMLATVSRVDGAIDKVLDTKIELPWYLQGK